MFTRPKNIKAFHPQEAVIYKSMLNHKEELIDLGGGFQIIQSKDHYRFTSDSVLLSNFTKVKANDRVCDLCGGCGIVGYDLLVKNKVIKHLTVVEMQKPLADSAKRTSVLNKIEHKVTVINKKIQNLGKEYYEKFDLITCNPPYMKTGGGDMSEKPEIALCRFEIALDLETLIKKAAKLLKFSGRFSFIHRSERIADIIFYLRKNKLEPKRIKIINGIILCEAVKGGKPGCIISTEIR